MIRNRLYVALDDVDCEFTDLQHNLVPDRVTGQLVEANRDGVSLQKLAEGSDCFLLEFKAGDNVDPKRSDPIYGLSKTRIKSYMAFMYR